MLTCANSLKKALTRSSVGTVVVSQRFFSGPQRPLHTVDIDLHPNVSTEDWIAIRDSLKKQLVDCTDPMLKQKMELAVTVAENCIKAFPNRKFKRNLTQDEAGAVDQIATVIDNISYKHGMEINHRVIQGYDTRDEYFGDCSLYGPFGTEDAPVYVPSIDNHRFVGCLGGYDGVEEHDMVWFLVRQGPKHRCPLCGQIFQLITSDTSHRDHPLHDPAKDYKRERWERMSNVH
jgi:hypothetical protein